MERREEMEGTGMEGNDTKRDGMEEGRAGAADVDALVALLDGCTQAGDRRIKVSGGVGQGGPRQHHHGRCDIGSPWACGTAFDVLE